MILNIGNSLLSKVLMVQIMKLFIIHTTKKFKKISSEVYEFNSDIERLNSDIQEISNKISQKESQLSEFKAEQAAFNQQVSDLSQQKQDLEQQLSDKTTDLHNIDSARARFKAGIPDIIQQEMTDLLRTYGVSDPTLISEFSREGLAKEIISSGDDPLEVQLPHLISSKNQYIDGEGVVQESIRNDSTNPMTQLLKLATCKPGEWITDGNGQKLQLTEDSAVARLAGEIRDKLTSSDNEKVWFLLRNETSTDLQKAILKNLFPEVNFDDPSHSQSIENIINEAITADVKNAIQAGSHTVVQGKDPGFFGSVEHSADNVATLSLDHRLDSMTHLSQIAT